jgi:hypothetical protein
LTEPQLRRMAFLFVFSIIELASRDEPSVLLGMSGVGKFCLDTRFREYDVVRVMVAGKYVRVVMVYVWYIEKFGCAKCIGLRHPRLDRRSRQKIWDNPR